MEQLLNFWISGSLFIAEVVFIFSFLKKPVFWNCQLRQIQYLYFTAGRADIGQHHDARLPNEWDIVDEMAKSNLT